MLFLYITLCLMGFVYLEDVNSEIVETTHRNTSSGHGRQIPRSWMLQLLCQVTNTYSGRDVTTQGLLRRRYAMEGNDLKLSPLKEVLQLRRLDVMACCKNDSERHIKGCVDHIRRKRIDTLCSRDSTHHVPFTVSRDVFMKDRVAHCCYKLGANRYDCFGEGASQVGFGTHTEYSSDETDPINDIWNYQLNTTLLNEALNSSSPDQARQLINKLGALDGDRARQSRDLQAGKVKVIAKEKTTLMSVLNSNQKDKSVNETSPSAVQHIHYTENGTRRVSQSANVRHPGAILESFRKHAVSSSKSTFSRMSGSEIRDLLSNLQQQWWVRHPEPEKKTLNSKVKGPDVMNAKQSPEPTSDPGHRIIEEDMAATKKVHEREQHQETSQNETMRQNSTDKRGALNETVNQGQNCTYSILGYDDMKGKSLHETLRTKFKHDKFGNP